MSLTVPELKSRLAQLDLDQLIELLQVTPELLVELATDYIEENYDEINAVVAEEYAEFQPEEWRQ